VLRDGRLQQVEARGLVPGDVLVIEEGDRICADARLLEGALEVDLSTLTGESQPVFRSTEFVDTTGPMIEARDLVFSGASCIGGDARALVYATGMQTELGRIAALSQRVDEELSPLEVQVRRVAWLITLVAVGAGILFLPIGWLAAGLPLRDSFIFAIGLIVANVPEGLLPTITLSLAVGVAALARRGALVKRLSAVETLGSTTVICTDKTGTLTENRMRAVRIWTPLGEPISRRRRLGPGGGNPVLDVSNDRRLHTADWIPEAGKSRGEATEVGLLGLPALGVDVAVTRREHRRRIFASTRSCASCRRSTTRRGHGATKGAPEEVLQRST
jgi:magnesium-transporting ATPase (P-type)